MAQCIRRLAKEFLGIPRGGGGRKSEAWWWNEEERDRIEEKQNAYVAISNSTLEEEKDVREATYKAANKLAKKAVTIVKNNAYERLYRKLGTREGEKDVFKLARLKEKKTRNLRNIRCIIDEDGKLLVEKAKIQQRWRSYLST